MDKSVFTNQQFEQIYPEGIEYHYWNHARNRIILDFLRESDLVNENILEIGGGRGIVTKFLHDHGLHCTGVEEANVQPIKGSEDYFFTGTNAFFLSEEIRKEIRVILLADVIEHIEYPDDFFKQIIQSFSHATHIVLTVPARQELWTNFDDFNGHIKRYSLTDLQIFQQEMIYIKGSYFNHILYPVFWLFANIIKKRSVRLIAPSASQMSIHRFLSFILQKDFHLLPSNWKGTSCIAVYKIPK